MPSRRPKRSAKSQKLKDYWRKVHRVMRSEGVPSGVARYMLKEGMFSRPLIDIAVDESMVKRFDVKEDSAGRVIFRRKEDEERISRSRFETSMKLTTYHVMVRRMQAWTGWTREKVRGFLSVFPNWRDGISPLFRKRR